MSGRQPLEELFDESRLRRALRLEASELPPRLDAAWIVAGARASSPARVAASFLSAVVAGAAGATLLAAVAIALSSVGPAFASEALGALLATLARVAVPLNELAATARQPTIPIAALSALVLAIAYEYTQRRERAHGVRSS